MQNSKVHGIATLVNNLNSLFVNFVIKTALQYLEIVAILQEVDASSQGTKPVKGVSAKGKGGGSVAKKGKDTPSGKGGAGDIGVDDFPMPQKPPSTMKKRGEEDLDSKYIGL